MSEDSQEDPPKATNGSVDETTSLLPKPDDGHGLERASTADGECEVVPEDAPRWRRVAREFAILLRASAPVILAYTLQNSLQTVSIAIVGRGAPEDLAVAAFAFMFAMATAWLIALGGTTALDTLASSTFTASKDKHDLGVLLQRAFLVYGLMYVPIAVLWIFSEPVFLALGQEPVIASGSQQFLRRLVPGGLGYIYFEAMKKYLQAQGTAE